MPLKTHQVFSEALGDELLVFHHATMEAASLNRTARWVYERCDGRTPVLEVARLLELELSTEGGEELVRMALDRLKRRGLVQGWSGKGISRRDFLDRFGKVAALLPAISVTLAPTPAYALSRDCMTVGDAGCTTALLAQPGQRFSGCSEPCKTSAGLTECANQCAKFYCADPTNPSGDCVSDDGQHSLGNTARCLSLFSTGTVNFSCAAGRSAAVSIFFNQLTLQCASGLDSGSFNCPTVNVVCPTTMSTVSRRMFEYVCCDC